MAVPVNATLHRQAPLKSGIILGVSPSSDPTFDVEIARATSGVYETIARLSPQGSGVPVSYTDILPVTTGVFAYKARAVKEGYEAGDYTAVLEVSPIALPEWKPNITPLTGKGIGAPLFQSTGTAITYGRANNQAYFSKTLRILGTAVQPAGNTVAYSFNSGGGIRPTTGLGSTAYNFQLVVPLPPESVVEGFSILYRRDSTARQIRCTMYSVSTNGNASTQGDILNPPAGAGVFFKTSTSVTSFTVGDAANILLRAILYSTAGGDSVAIQRVDVNYQIPNLNQTL